MCPSLLSIFTDVFICECSELRILCIGLAIIITEIVIIILILVTHII